MKRNKEQVIRLNLLKSRDKKLITLSRNTGPNQLESIMDTDLVETQKHVIEHEQ